MNWLLLGALIASAAALGFLVGWGLCRTRTRIEAQIAAVRANLARPNCAVGNHGAWRYRNERSPSASRRILGARERGVV